MIVDHGLVRRVEASAARISAVEVESLRERGVHGDPAWLAVDGGVLVAMGAGRYVNRGVGVGLGGTGPHELLDTVEAFYTAHDLPPSLEVCPWVPSTLVAELRARGYGVQWFRNVYGHSLRKLPPRASMQIVEVHDDELEQAWTDILGSQFEVGTPARTTSDEFATAIHGLNGGLDLVAMLDGRPVGSGSVVPVRTIAWLRGAATLPEARGRGAQHALLVDRLHRAARMGCNLAAVTATPDGVSARNLLRVGFQLLYTQAVLTRTT